MLGRSAELGRCELIRGELKMMSPAGGSHGIVGMRLVRALNRFLGDQDLGECTLAETGFILDRNPDTVRAPDIAFIAAERLAEALTPKFIPIPPDLAVEVNSPSDTAGDVADKTRWWLAHGTRAVWVVDPKSQTVATHAPDGRAHVYGRDDTLPGGEVLPGFELPLAELFAGD
ncbi:MAG: Uma2 family endonuclease [Planctomycetota bacterium]